MEVGVTVAAACEGVENMLTTCVAVTAGLGFRFGRARGQDVSHVGWHAAKQTHERPGSRLLLRGPLLPERSQQRLVHQRRAIDACGSAAAAQTPGVTETLQRMRCRGIIVNNAKQGGPSHRLVLVGGHADAISKDDGEVAQCFAVSSTMPRCHEHAQAVTERGLEY